LDSNHVFVVAGKHRDRHLGQPVQQTIRRHRPRNHITLCDMAAELGKLLQLNAATELASLRVPPGNQLEALKGDRKGQHSIRVNDQWRVCFVWREDGAHQVEIVDYH